jgi:hypothetical protein
VIVLKKTVARDFRPSVFFINRTHLGPLLTGEIGFEHDFVFAEIFALKVGKFGLRGVIDIKEIEN